MSPRIDRNMFNDYRTMVIRQCTPNPSIANLFAANSPCSIKSCGNNNLIGASNDLATVTITMIETKMNERSID
jgi:hypothetical protein